MGLTAKVREAVGDAVKIESVERYRNLMGQPRVRVMHRIKGKRFECVNRTEDGAAEDIIFNVKNQHLYIDLN